MNSYVIERDANGKKIKRALTPDEVAAIIAAKPPVADPVLTPARFAWLLAFTGLDDVWEALETALKAADRAAFATLKAQRAKSEFHLPVTLALVEQFRKLAEAAAPGADLSETAIRAAWEQAAAAKI